MRLLRLRVLIQHRVPLILMRGVGKRGVWYDMYQARRSYPERLARYLPVLARWQASSL